MIAIVNYPLRGFGFSTLFRAAGCAALAAGVLSFATGAQAQAQGLSARYSVSMLGLTLGQASLSGTFGPAAYKVEARAKLSGIARAISSAKGAAQSSGVIRSGRLLPSGYATISSNSHETRTVRMGMRGGNVRAVDITPPIPDRPGRVPLSKGHQRNIIDPLSAIVFPVAGQGPITGAAACNRTLPVFDGYTRFNITLRHAGTRNVRTRGYSGPAFICRARYVPIAGHRPHRKTTQFMVANRQMEVWLVPVGASRVMAPYKIAVNTLVGMVEITANRFLISGDSSTATVAR
ncbi:MAG: DUF3108 domain-containing protein [Hyphomicrobiales bacterium]|nr:DUF3108 domain-containing protein [Hyphomicrobiales bacterium]